MGTASHLVGLSGDLAAQGCNPCDPSQVVGAHLEDEVASGSAGAYFPFAPALPHYCHQVMFACTIFLPDARCLGAKWRVRMETPSLNTRGDSRGVLDEKNTFANLLVNFTLLL